MMHPTIDIKTFLKPGVRAHLAGIGGAQCVVAINSDPEAPIFGHATYSVVGDCVEILRDLTSRLENR